MMKIHCFNHLGNLKIEDSESDIAAMMKPQKSRNNNPRWRKARTFSKEIPTTPTFNIFHTFPDLLAERPFDLRRSCVANTYTYVCVLGGKKCSFLGKFGALCFLEIPVLRFALLPY